jgi:hypothetical protein
MVKNENIFTKNLEVWNNMRIFAVPTENSTKTNYQKTVDMSEIELNKWYTSLTIADKEAITGKKYPACSKVWNEWTLEQRTDAKEKSSILRGRRIKENPMGHDF